jgi:transcriptional regulator with XRE-family HTH domain
MGKIRANPKLRKRVFLREWRDYRGFTLEQVAEQMGVTAGALSQAELGKTNYTRPMLEFLADLYRCEPGDLLMRNPLDTESPWSIWDHAQPAQREQIISMMRIIVGEKTGTDG